MDTERFRLPRPPVAKDATVYSSRGPLRMPLDLSQWVAPEKLLEWVREEIGRLDPARKEVMEFRRMLPEIRPEVLLTLVVYSYLTKTFASEDVVRACREETLQQRICDGKPPFAQEIEQFRRKHRILLEDMLAEILLRAVHGKYVDLEKLPPGMEYGVFVRAKDRLDTARLMDETDGEQ